MLQLLQTLPYSIIHGSNNLISDGEILDTTDIDLTGSSWSWGNDY